MSDVPGPDRTAGGPSLDDDFDGPRWYRSLYWRAAIALITLIALLLAAEGALFLWLSAEKAGAMPRDPRRMAVNVASDVANALTAQKELDLREFLQSQYGHYFQTILVVMRDSRIAANHDDVEEEILEDVRTRVESRRRFGGGRGFRGQFGDERGGPPLPPDDFGPPGRRGGPPPDGRGFGRGGPPPDGRGGPPPDGRGGPRPDGRGFGPPPDGRGGPPPGGFDGGPPPDGGGPGGEPGPGPDQGPRGGRDGFFDFRRRPLNAEFSQIVVDNTIVGTVVLMSGAPPFSRVLTLVGPSMALVAGGVLVVGGALIALVVFGPARRRLRQVQEATEQLGGGDLKARAPEGGGDEIAAVARSFNHMADELTRRAQALESSDRARRQLLADVSHELMTPLTAMRGYIETLSMTELQLDASTRERYMRIVSEETTRLENIIGDLLDLARLEGGGTTMRREQVTVDVLFNRVAERHERELEERRIVLDVHVGAGAEELTGDGDRLEQALQNLVANALRYTPDDGHISLTAARRAAGTMITVHDSGPGVPDDQMSLIFDRFYKGDSSRRSAGGSGLGLSIVKAIIERHGGTITVRNDGGAAFEITLP